MINNEYVSVSPFFLCYESNALIHLLIVLAFYLQLEVVSNRFKQRNYSVANQLHLFLLYATENLPKRAT